MHRYELILFISLTHTGPYHYEKAVTITGQVSYFHGRIMEGDSRWPVYRVLVQNVSSHRWYLRILQVVFICRLLPATRLYFQQADIITVWK